MYGIRRCSIPVLTSRRPTDFVRLPDTMPPVVGKRRPPSIPVEAPSDLRLSDSALPGLVLLPSRRVHFVQAMLADAAG